MHKNIQGLDGRRVASYVESAIARVSAGAVLALPVLHPSPVLLVSDAGDFAEPFAEVAPVDLDPPNETPPLIHIRSSPLVGG